MRVAIAPKSILAFAIYGSLFGCLLDASAAVRQSTNFKILSDGPAAAAGRTTSTNFRMFSVIADARPTGKSASTNFRAAAGTARIIGRTPPQIANIDSLADTGDGLIAEGESVGVSVTQLLAIFTQRMFDPPGHGGSSDVTNPLNYEMFEGGGNAVVDSPGCSGLGSDDVSIAIDSVSYDSTTTMATLSINGGTALVAGTYQLFVCGTNAIENVHGVDLDGNGNSLPGGAFGRGFVVSDNDDDGLLDDEDPDDDNDGMTDVYENAHTVLDPLDPSDAGEDPDNDGLTNLEEFTINPNIDPNDPDTDGDGLQDSLDATPVTANSLCSGDISNLDSVVISDAQQCAAATSVTIIGATSVTGSGNLEVYSPLLIVNPEFSVSGQFSVHTTNPCPACP